MTAKIGMFLLCLFLFLFSAPTIFHITVDPMALAVCALFAAFFLFIPYVIGKDFSND